MIGNDVSIVPEIGDGDLCWMCRADRKKKVVEVDGRKKAVEVLMKKKGSVEKVVDKPPNVCQCLAMIT